jgi:hypothetical protein
MNQPEIAGLGKFQWLHDAASDHAELTVAQFPRDHRRHEQQQR